MNARLSLRQLRNVFDAALNATPGSVHCGTSYDRDFLELLPKTWPAVWVLAQRLTPLDDGRGFTQRKRQKVRVELAVRVVVQRYPDGVINGELALNELHDLVSAAGFGAVLTGADEGLSWAQSLDGPPAESVMTSDLVFETETTYQRSNA